MTESEDTPSHLPDEKLQAEPPPASVGHAAETASNVADNVQPLDDLIASIRAAVAPGVSAEARASGATACRAILAALETQVGQPLASATPAAMLTGILSQLATMSREEILEFLRSKFPAGIASGQAARPPTGPRFHLIQVPPVRPRGKGP